MIGYTRRALRQVDELVRHYEELGREEAIDGLLSSLGDAEQKIEDDPGAGLATPRPYPELVEEGEAWVKSGRYWVAYSTARPPVIIAVFYETSDIPGRI